MLVDGSVVQDHQLAEAIGKSFHQVSNDILPLTFQQILVASVSDKYLICSEEVEARSLRV